MAIVRWKNESWDPGREMQNLRSEIDRLFEFPSVFGPQGIFDRSSFPAVDLIETAEGFTVVCDLPGVDQADLNLSIASDVLTIKGEKKQEKAKNAKVFRKETWEGGFQRTISLPASVDSSKVKAVLKDGILRLEIPKREEVKAKRIELKTS